jgi:hypothetical protein
LLLPRRAFAMKASPTALRRAHLPTRGASLVVDEPTSLHAERRSSSTRPPCSLTSPPPSRRSVARRCAARVHARDPRSKARRREGGSGLAMPNGYLRRVRARYAERIRANRLHGQNAPACVSREQVRAEVRVAAATGGHRGTLAAAGRTRGARGPRRGRRDQEDRPCSAYALTRKPKKVGPNRTSPGASGGG